MEGQEEVGQPKALFLWHSGSTVGIVVPGAVLVLEGVVRGDVELEGLAEFGDLADAADDHEFCSATHGMFLFGFVLRWLRPGRAAKGAIKWKNGRFGPQG